ncbi:MAG TPA: betaine--homocysteine S-methyltransferase [Anaerolineales bacterium]|nr:betaine--homocysteine S-methyltransferase [Anaerolineales bacterium]
MNPLEKLLSTHEYILTDGATGTTLMGWGLVQGDPPESWNLTEPDKIRKMHRNFIRAGSQIILTNTFGGTRFRLKLHKLDDRVREINVAAARLARLEAGVAEQLVVVAGSMGPSGEIIQPLGDLHPDDARAGFAEQAAALDEGGVDVLWIETMSDLKEVRAAAEGARSVSELPLVITMTFDTNGHTMMGVSPVQALEAIREYEPIAMGGNCGNGPGEIESVIAAMYAVGLDVPLVAKSNAGMPVLKDGQAHYAASPAEMARYAVRVRNLGATIVGGCCGNSVDHIRAMAEALEVAPVERVRAEPGAEPDAPKARRERRHIRDR